VTGSCELGNEYPGSLKGAKFLYQLSHCYILKKDYFPELVSWSVGQSVI